MSHVSSATYPLSKPLAILLKATTVYSPQQEPPRNPRQEETVTRDTTPLPFLEEKEKKQERDTLQQDGMSTNNIPHSLQFDLESKTDALQHFVRNCFVAIDNLLFATPWAQRQRSSFQHRQLIRVTTDEVAGTLTITDLGIGMTRSDLINSLVGVGSRLSLRAIQAAKDIDNQCHHELILGTSLQDNDNGGGGGGGDNESNEKNHDLVISTNESEKKHDEDVEDDGRDNDHDDDSQESTCSSSSSSCSSTTTPWTSEGESNLGKDKDMKQHNSRGIQVPCQAKDIGSFFAAFCAIGTHVEIGTKSKFDDYYIFRLPADSCKKDYSYFSITRPMEEGVKPSVNNGFTSLVDVRGDSGTRVTITLNQSAIEAGFLQQEEVLKPMFEKFLEASPYSVVLDKCCTEEQRKEIIEATQLELDDLRQEQGEQESNEQDHLEEEDEILQRRQQQDKDDRVDESHNSVKERAKFIPIRLSMGERKMLRLVEAAMACCDYTTEIDKPFKSTTRRMHTQMKHITAILRGMVTACDYSAGQKLLDEENYSDFEQFFRQVFEIARRHKIMNPEKMRTEYGKLIYLLQDAVSPSIMPHLSFSCKGDIKTVYKFLEARGGLSLLEDPLIEIATREVLAEKKTRSQISHEIRRKERAVAHLKQQYQNRLLSSEDIHLCLYSICDNDSFLNSNRVPIDKIINYLHQFFSPEQIEDGYSLSIVDGQDGSRLSHSHERQFYFALQSLTLWRDIIDDMFRLWAMAEDDLLSESVSYVLQDTGQGFQRVQQSPLTYRAMQKILLRVQAKVSNWVGSNVIHLGDHNVPNALTFIDKYTQVPRILAPIVNCLENLERICEEDDGISKLIDNGFGGVEQLKKDILYDFFKSAFDGSGADNFYDAGSCIDGRLTSAWNWCSQLQDKPFFCIFKLNGFTGFDGEFV